MYTGGMSYRKILAPQIKRKLTVRVEVFAFPPCFAVSMIHAAYSLFHSSVKLGNKPSPSKPLEGTVCGEDYLITVTGCKVVRQNSLYISWRDPSIAYA